MDKEQYFQSPRIWGAHFWFMIYSVIAAYNPNDEVERDGLEMFMVSLATLLPCLTCRQHYLDYLSTHEMTIHDKTSMWKWVYHLQKEIDERNGKTALPQYEDWLKHVMTATLELF